MKADVNPGGLSVLQTQIGDWRSCQTPAAPSAASCSTLRSQLRSQAGQYVCQPRIQALWSICCSIKTAGLPCGKVHVISSPHQAKKSDLMTRTINSKLKDHKRLLSHTDLQSEITMFSPGRRERRNICFWNDTEGKHMQGMPWRGNFHGVWQQQHPSSRLYNHVWHVLCFHTGRML